MTCQSDRIFEKSEFTKLEKPQTIVQGLNCKHNLLLSVPQPIPER